MSAAPMRKPDQAQMLAELAQAVNIEQCGDKARAAHERLKASIWTAEDRDRGRQMGRDEIARRARDYRLLWRKEAIKLIVDNFDAGNYISRKSLLMGLHSYGVIHNFIGKCGESMDINTIRQWLTAPLEEEIRFEAITQLVERARRS